VPVTSDDFTHSFTATRSGTSGPLGTFWRVDTFDLASVSTIGNPIFLADPATRPDAAPAPPSTTSTIVPAGRRLPATGGGGLAPLTAPLVLAAGVALAVVRRSRA
jgi:hypothetical protein